MTDASTETAADTAGGTASSRLVPRNPHLHLAALSATKTADGLIDPKLVLAWLLSAVGAPGYLTGLLVPVREAGALLPQLLYSRPIQSLRHRRWVWAGGSLVQGAAAFGMAACLVLLEGAAAGWGVLGCLAVLALARAACSASYKDVLARTVEKGRRGRITGAAGSVAAALVLAFAALISLGAIPRTVPAISTAVAVAGGLWIAAGLVFSLLDEPAATPEDGASREGMWRILRGDREFRVYLATRGLLIATALAPPFLVMLSQEAGGNRVGDLGALLIASATATILSSYVWGRQADRSSRRTLIRTSALGAVALGAAAATGIATGGLGPVWATAGFVFLVQIAYQGVRAGRSIHLTDMDTGGRKPVYTALANTLIGALLLAGGSFGLLAELVGPAPVLAVMAGMCALAILPALRLSEVQKDG